VTPSVRAVFLAVIGLGLLAVAPPVSTESRVIDLSIRNGELPADTRVVRVRQGDDVTLRWTTDAALAIHLHGYDLERKLAPGPSVSMRFTAKATGRFPIEVHAHGPGGDRTLGYVEVHPR
jgi:FtsP/CotA-like multicopper oxidase with cupredoxin domain